jgi:hypothetical protein
MKLAHVNLIQSPTFAESVRHLQPGGWRWVYLCRVIAVCLCICLLATGSSADDIQHAPDSEKNLLPKIVDAVSQIQAIQLTVTTHFSEKAAKPQDAELDSHGAPVESRAQICWDSRQKCRVTVRNWCLEPLRHLTRGLVYDEYAFTLDGVSYRGASSVTHRAKIEPRTSVRLNYITPLVFLGFSMTDLDVNVFQYLFDQGPDKCSERLLDDGTWELTAEYDPPDGSYRRQILVIADPSEDFLPVRIITKFKWSDTLDQEILVTRFEVVDGIRIPVAGSCVSYAIEEIYPDGLTNGEVNAMSRDDYFKNIEPRVVRRAQLVGDVTKVDFSHSELRVNQIQPDSFFHLEIPAGYDVVDFSVAASLPADPGKRDLGAVAASDDQVSERGTVGMRRWSDWFFAFLLMNGLLFASIQLWKRSKTLL